MLVGGFESTTYLQPLCFSQPPNHLMTPAHPLNRIQIKFDPDEHYTTSCNQTNHKTATARVKSFHNYDYLILSAFAHGRRRLMIMLNSTVLFHGSILIKLYMRIINAATCLFPGPYSQYV